MAARVPEVILGTRPRATSRDDLECLAAHFTARGFSHGPISPRPADAKTILQPNPTFFLRAIKVALFGDRPAVRVVPVRCAKGAGNRGIESGAGSRLPTPRIVMMAATMMGSVIFSP
jgi:hypothetical protein